MGDHFRLRKSSDLRTMESTETRTHLKVIHAISFTSILLAAFSVGVSLYNSSKISTNVEVAGLEQNEKKPTKDFDKYRGYKKVKGEALGYFNFQKTDAGQWSLVTPEGDAFFGMAVNKVYPWNIESAAYKEKFNNSDTTWALSATTLIDSMRLNTLGNSAFLDPLIQPKVLRFPYTLTGNYVEWESADRITKNDFPDVWSTAFAADVDTKTKKMSEKYGKDPYVELFWPANEMHFNLQKTDGTADSASVYWKKLIQEDGKTPAKDAWVGLYKTRYTNDIAAVNKVYGTTMTTFDDMYTLGLGLYDRFTTIEPGEEADAQKAYEDTDDWSTEIAKQFHKVIYETMKTYMPNIIVTSERLVQANHSPLYFKKIKPYIDALALNLYITAENIAPNKDMLDRYSALVDGKPLVISEHSYLQEPCNLSDDGGTYPGAATQSARADAHLAYRDSILQNPAVTYLGWHEYSDSKSVTNTCGYTNFGLVSMKADPYQEMIDQAKATWQDFNVLRWQKELLLDSEQANPYFPSNTNANPVTNTDTSKAPTTPVTNTNTAGRPVTNTNTSANPATNTNAARNPITNVNGAANPTTNVNTAKNPIKDVGQILKPVTGVTKGKRFATNTNTAANPLTNTSVGANPLTNTNTGANPLTNTNTAANPLTNTNTGSNPLTNTNTAANPTTDTGTAPNRATQTDISLKLPDSTDGVADLLPTGPTLAGFFATPAKKPSAPAATNTNTPNLKK